MGPQSGEKRKPLRPNILVTGTPGTGKSTLSHEIANELGLRHIDVGEFAKERNLLAEHNAELNFHYLHEDAVLDALEPIMIDGGVILDHHSCDWFPERWIQLVVILRASTEVLYDRLEARKYPMTKVQENVQAEIFQVSRDEALESYKAAKHLELDSSSEEQRAQNMAAVRKAYRALSQQGSASDVAER